MVGYRLFVSDEVIGSARSGATGGAACRNRLAADRRRCVPHCLPL